QYNTLPPSIVLSNVDWFDKYPITSGAFASIHKGIFQMKTIIAVKNYGGSDQFLSETQINQIYYREALVWRQLKHDNILPFLGVFVDGTSPCVVSPWLENGNLRAYVAANQLAGNSVTLLVSSHPLIKINQLN
ncbi:hypothetical protein JAAARDRAFT_142566, partial [Jaapia argillacea MUCL 33604]